MGRKRVFLRSIGERIKYLRENKEIECAEQTGTMTQQMLADRLDVSLDTVKNWEQGYNYPSVDMLARIADKFDCDIDFLFGNQGERRKYSGLSSEAALNLSRWGASEAGAPYCRIVSDLAEHPEMIERVHDLTAADYSSVRAMVGVPDVFQGQSFTVSRNDIARSQVAGLFIAISEYIDRNRSEKNLPTLREVLGRNL